MDARTIIQKLGGPSAAARLFECRPAAVSQWKRNNKIPNARLLHLKASHPELFEPADHSTGAEPKPGATFGEFGEPRNGDRREDDRRQQPDPDFGNFGEPRDGDRRQQDRRQAVQADESV